MSANTKVSTEDRIAVIKSFFKNNEDVCMDFAHMNYMYDDSTTILYALDYCTTYLSYMSSKDIERLYDEVQAYDKTHKITIPPVDNKLYERIMDC